MKKEVQDIIKANVDHIDADELVPVFNSALELSVATDLLDVFCDGDVAVPPEQLFESLKKHYIDSNPALSPAEKEAKTKIIQYLINRYQISIFESMMKSK